MKLNQVPGVQRKVKKIETETIAIQYNYYCMYVVNLLITW